MTPLNSSRGEVELAAAGKVYRLRFGAAALLAIEERLDEVYPKTKHAALKVLVETINGAAAGEVSERVLHVLLLEGLREFHPGVAREEVLALREAAGITACVKAVETAALRSSLDIKPLEEAAPVTADPPSPPAG
ncbi:MAG: hypothetical protein HUU06_03855 [Planctomycetaceae bacterium]|nr:hypothetical protein [Planctomycetaceae bacterium]